MKRKIIIGAIVILLLVILSALGLFFLRDNNQTSNSINNPKEQTSNNIKAGNQINNSINFNNQKNNNIKTGKIFKRSNLQDCQQNLLKDNYTQNDFSLEYYYVVKSFLNKNQKFCKLLRNKDSVDNCDNIYNLYASLINNNCQNIKNNKTAYSFCLANSKHNINLCPTENKDSQQICQAITKGDETMCQGLKNTRTDHALNRCQNEAYLAKAVRSKNVSLCQKIQAINPQGSAEKFICNVFTGNSQSNLTKELNSFKENICYERYGNITAREKNNKSICEKIPWKGDFGGIEYQECINQFNQ